LRFFLNFSRPRFFEGLKKFKKIKNKKVIIIIIIIIIQHI